MALVEDELKKITRMIDGLLDGTIKPLMVAQAIPLLSQSEKRMRGYLDMAALTLKYGAKGTKLIASFTEINLIGDGSAIDTDTYIAEVEKIKCPQKEGELIERQECLDFSGEEKRYDDCRGCNHFAPTRRLILGVKKASDGPESKGSPLRKDGK